MRRKFITSFFKLLFNYKYDLIIKQNNNNNYYYNNNNNKMILNYIYNNK